MKGVHGCYLSIAQGSLLTPWIFNTPGRLSRKFCIYWAGMLRVLPIARPIYKYPYTCPLPGELLVSFPWWGL